MKRCTSKVTSRSSVLSRRPCVTFDLDDTLYSEVDYLRSGFAAVSVALSARYGEEAAFRLRGRAAIGQWRDAFDDVATECNLPADAVAFMVQVYRTHAPNIALRAGVCDALRQLRARGAHLACITDGESKRQRAKLAALGLDGVFTPLIISEEIGADKTDPRGFEAVMRSCDAASYWYVGDNLMKDFIHPRRLGWKCICITSSDSVHSNDFVEWPVASQPHYWLGASEFGRVVELVLSTPNQT